MKKELLTPKEAAAYYQVGESTLLEWLRKGKIHGIKTAGTWRIHYRELRKMTTFINTAQLENHIGEPIVVHFIHPQDDGKTERIVVLADVLMNPKYPRVLDNITVLDNVDELINEEIIKRQDIREIHRVSASSEKPSPGPSSSAYNIGYSLVAGDSELSPSELSQLIDFDELGACADAALGGYDARMGAPAPNDSELGSRRLRIFGGGERSNQEIIHYLRVYFLTIAGFSLPSSHVKGGWESQMAQRATQDASRFVPPRAPKDY